MFFGPPAAEGTPDAAGGPAPSTGTRCRASIGTSARYEWIFNNEGPRAAARATQHVLRVAYLATLGTFHDGALWRRLPKDLRMTL